MLTRNGWTTAALCAATLTVGLVAGYVELVAVGAMLLVALGTAVAWLFLRPSIEVSRSVGPTHVAEGEGASAVLSVTNSGVRRTPPLLARERMADRTVRIELGRLAPDSTSRTSYALPTDRRGVFEVGPLELSHGDALGLVTVIYGQGAVARLVV
ncbi:MAG: DUF58 domain-containing protein, partial [Acidimicrobiia bacterium]|nr:DUF58 domain-containing protein [Acidimicrobiia bacterium]